MPDIIARAIAALAIVDHDERDWRVSGIYHEIPEDHAELVAWQRARDIIDSAYYGGSDDRERRGF